MNRIHAGLTCLLLLVGLPSISMAGDLPSTPCLAPLTSDEYDPAVRDVLVRNTSKETIAEFCVVSKRKGFRFIGATASLFDRNGHLLRGTNSYDLFNVRPRKPDQTGAPPIIIRPLVSVSPPLVNVGPAVLVQVAWVECDIPPDEACKKLNPTTDLYIMEFRRR